uniref:ATPase family AAA domain containing 5a n=1 Tax=Oryzias melastigma TaxID=30732 RepID=A0A3B3C6H7_ORYME
MSYFCRKAPSSKEQTCPPEPSLENCQKPQAEEKQKKSEGKRQGSQKRGKKTGRAARELVTTESISNDVDCMTVEKAPESKDSAAELQSNAVVDVTESDQVQKKDSKSKSALQISELTPRDESKSSKTSRKQRKKKQSPSEPEKEAECDVSAKVSDDDTSCVKDSTVKISFEEFLRSQSKDEDDKSEDEAILSEEKLTAEEMDIPKAEQHVDFLASPLQISPRTVTTQAEVHTISPNREEVKTVGKMASIFTQKRRSNSPVETGRSPPTDSGPKLSSPTVKLKSNVVLQEEDLELYVLESDSAPKCSEAERKQFMAAFKQPSLDGPKSKPVKSQGKQKDAAEKTADAEDVIIQPTAEETPPEIKEATKKRTKKERIKEKKEDSNTSPADPDVTETPPTPVMRRSKREAVIRQTSQSTPTTPARKTRRQQASNEGITPVKSQESPIKLVPSKTRKSKHGVFVAEIISPPDTKQSPIRIKFSRVHKNKSASEAETEVDKTSSQRSRTTNESRKRKQAKKLVEKAKQVIEQNKKSAVKQETVRRSGRNKAVFKGNYCDDEDSIICLEDQSTSSQDAPEKNKPPKALRSLNDVLGKAAGKDVKTAPGSKSASLGQEKSAQRPSAVISIFDDSSCEGSENSKDDGQFKARREFLKSGLPESFKKQIAKTVASKEAYSASCSSFQPVTHTTQTPDDCPLWSLPWPKSSLLSHLKDLWSQTPNPLPPISGSLGVTTKSTCRNPAQTRWDLRPEFSESVRQLLVEEFRTSNPNFPAETCMNRLMKRRVDHQLLSTPAEPKAGSSSTQQPVGGKRKRSSNEGETTGKVAKKQKCSQSEDNVYTAAPESPRRESRTRRSQRSRLQDGEEVKKKSSLKPAPKSKEDDSVVVIDDVILVEDTRKKDPAEDLLWTDKYQPQLCSEIIDNSASVKRLHSWLKEWKIRTDREEKKNQKSNKEEGSIDSDWDGADEYGEDTLCNTMLIVGPTGVGKTAAVYACAQELGFKVFEVNASSQRSGRLILSQLKEATQSHQVDSQGLGPPKPSYFNSYGTSSGSGSLRPGSSPRKGNSPRRVASSPRKNPQSPRGAKKGGLAPVSLANFFKVGKPTNKDPSISTKDEQKAVPKKVMKATESGSKKKDIAAKSSSDSTSDNKSSEERSKKTATSLILFEEVNVIFDDDSGFLAAIKTFMSTTKRPVILTTSDPAFSSIFDGSFEEVHFKPPSVMNVGGFLQLLCLAENVRTDPADVRSLLRLNRCDIRQSLLQLQFWSSSADGQLSAETLKHTDSISKEKLEPGSPVPSLPLCEKGCTESKLGLLNIKPDQDFWKLFRSPMTESVNWELLMESKQRGVDLLYSNLESLLPLPRTQLSTSKLFRPELPDSLPQEPPFGPSLQQPPPVCDGLPPSATSVNESNESDSNSPIKVSSRMKKNKKRSLNDQDRLESESDSEDGFVSLREKQTSSPAVEAVKETVALAVVKRKPLTPEERIKSAPVSQCLQSMADFMDNMSYMDSFLCYPDGGDICRRTPPGGAVIKDGMTDESRVETERERWIMGSRTLEIQAAVEGLSFHKCRESAADAWDKVQQLGGELEKEATAEVTLPLASHREGWTFTQESHCQPQLVQQRNELMGSLMFGGQFGTQGNRQAAALDYLPVIRTICRSEQLKEQGKVKRRFLHYLDAIHLGLDKGTLLSLAEDFP